MRSSLPFFRLFPPPKFMLMSHAGLDISDDGMHCVAYSGFGGTRHISLHGHEDFPPGLFAGGEISDEKVFVSKLAEFGKRYNLFNVKVSVSEEKAYLFETEVPSTEQKAIEQNIEFKLEENVPLSASDAVFYFDLLPRAVTGGSIKASVSVVPRGYIEHYMSLIVAAGLQPISFETVPKAIARSVISISSTKTRLIIYVMSRKTGIYVVSGNVVHFAFTAPWGTENNKENGAQVIEEMRKEIARIRLFWVTHGDGKDIDEAVLVGRNAPSFESVCHRIEGDKPLGVRVADVWANAINVDKYLPEISRLESLEYAVAAGLAFDTPRSV